MSDPFTDPNANPFDRGSRPSGGQFGQFGEGQFDVGQPFTQQSFGQPAQAQDPFGQASGQPAYGQFGQPPAPTGARTGVIVAIVMVVVLLGVGGVVLALFADGTGTLGSSVPDGPRLVEVNGSIESPGGTWRHEFTVPRTGNVQIDVIGASGFDPVLTLHGSSGIELGRDDDGGDGLNSRLRTSLTEGRYSLEVVGFASTLGRFEVFVTEG
ncbi:hypothetical protein BH23ACT9_BH23ACT9_27730 [soil metagenome]